MVKKENHMSAKERRRQERAERIRVLEKSRKRSVILLTVFLGVLLGGVVDSHALYSFGILQVDPFTLYSITGVLGAACAIGAFWSWRDYRAVSGELDKIRGF